MKEVFKLFQTLLIGIIFGFIITLSYVSLPTTYQHSFKQPQKILSTQLLIEKENRTIADEISSKISILCLMILPDASNYQRTSHIKETWGRRCNVLIFLESEDFKGTKWESFINGLKYVYDYYLEGVEWIFYSDLMTYAVLENMRFMLQSYDATVPIIFARKKLPKKQEIIYEAGFILSKEALRRFIVEFSMGNQTFCNFDNGAQNVLKHFKNCLRTIGVIQKDTLDVEMKDTFLDISFDDPHSQKINNYKIGQGKEGKITCLKGVKCFSTSPLVFIGISNEDMYVLEFLIYHLKPFGVLYNPDYKFD